MKILFLNKYDITGGAGIAAFRLHRGLERYYSCENALIVGVKRSRDSRVSASRGMFGAFIERGLNVLTNQVGLQYFAFPFSTHAIRRAVAHFQPDVISLHNIHGGFFKTSLLPELSRMAPLVWTLHDMWPFTGSAAHTFGDTSWQTMTSGRNEAAAFPRIGIDTGTWLLRHKKSLYGHTRLTIVAPSQWMNDMAAQAPVFEGKRVVRIYNGVDLEVFRPGKEKARAALGIPADADVVMFASEHLAKTQYKGGPPLVEILKIIAASHSQPVHVIVIGTGTLAGLSSVGGIVLHPQGYVREENRLALCYAAADVFVYPTKADNLPNSLVEAAACGTPSVTFDIGGCGEIIQDGISGYVVPPGSIDQAASRTMTLLKNRSQGEQFSREARRRAEERFSLEQMAGAYHTLMKSLR